MEKRTPAVSEFGFSKRFLSNQSIKIFCRFYNRKENLSLRVPFLRLLANYTTLKNFKKCMVSNFGIFTAPTYNKCALECVKNRYNFPKRLFKTKFMFSLKKVLSSTELFPISKILQIC